MHITVFLNLMLSLEAVKTARRIFSAVFGSWIVEAAAKDSKICAITAAMKDGTGLEEFAAHYPERFYDVGIAESHAVTFFSRTGTWWIPPCFCGILHLLQRAYDQVMQDVAIANEHVVLAVDRAGVVGEDGETHQGVLISPFFPLFRGLRFYLLQLIRNSVPAWIVLCTNVLDR